MLAPAEPAPNRPSPLATALLAAELGPVVMADDPCEAAFGAADPTGARNYYRARYYDPTTGRFISQDPRRWMEGPNAYQYGQGNPVRFRDPSGTSINVDITLLPWRFVDKTKKGTPGATVYEGTHSPVPGCRERDGAWGFEVTVYAEIHMEFVYGVDPFVWTSDETPGLTLFQHELLHVSDLVTGLADLDNLIKTEGFSSKPACECALKAFRENLLKATLEIEQTSDRRRDQEGDTTP